MEARTTGQPRRRARPIQCKCGSTTHFRTNHRECPLSSASNAVVGNRDDADTAPGVSQSTGSSVGRAVSANERARQQRQEAANKWRDAWVLDKPAVTYSVVTEEESLKQFEPWLKKHMETIAEKGRSFVQRARGASSQPLEVFWELLGHSPASMLKWMNEGKAGGPEIDQKQPDFNQADFYAFLSMWLVTSILGVDQQTALRIHEALVFKNLRYVPDNILSRARYGLMMKYASPYPPRRAGEHTYESVTDDTLRIREFEREVFARSARLMADSSTVLTEDDDQHASRAKDNPNMVLMSRKASPEGSKADTIADAFNRTILAVRFQEKGGKTVDKVLDALDRVKAAHETDGGLRNMLYCADRGYCSPQLRRALHTRGLSFVLIAPPIANEHPFSAASNVFPCTREGFVVDDAPKLGPGIVSATLTETWMTDRGRVARATRAFAIREFGNSKVCNVIRFFASGSNLPLHKYENTFVMSFIGRPKAKDLDTWLFYPGVQATGVKFTVEQELRKGITPLTAGQACYEWFQFKKLLITGTTGQCIASKDPDVRTVLFKDPNRSASGTNITDQWVMDSLCKSWFYKTPKSEKRAFRSGRMNEAPVVAQLRKQPWIEQVFEIGLVQSKLWPALGVSADGIVVMKEPTSARGRPATTFGALEIKTKVAETTMHDAELAALMDADASSSGRPVEITVGDDKWFSPRVPTIHRGQILHEATVLRVPYVLYVVATETGIVYSARIHVPKEHSRIYAESLSQWSRLTKWAHDLVNVDEASYADELQTALSNLVVTVSQATLDAIVSHLPMWLAFHRLLRDRRELLRPVKLVRSMVQHAYSVTKGGVDGGTQQRIMLQSQAYHHNWAKKMMFNMLSQVLSNAWNMWRIVTTRNEHHVWTSYTDFRKDTNKLMPFTSFAVAVGEALWSRAGTLHMSHMGLAPFARPVSPSANARHLTPTLEVLLDDNTEIDRLMAIKVPKKFRRDFFNGPVGIELRTSFVRHPLSMFEQMDRKKRSRTDTSSPMRGPVTTNARVPPTVKACVVCEKQTRYRCDVCRIPLHRLPCWDTFHAGDTLHKQPQLESSLGE